MKQTILVEGATLREYVDAYNETCAELSRFQIDSVQHISDTQALIYYTIPQELEHIAEDGPASDADYQVKLSDPDQEDTERIRVDIVVPRITGRKCCECDNYRWGRGCPYSDSMVRVMDDNCRMFQVKISLEV